MVINLVLDNYLVHACVTRAEYYKLHRYESGTSLCLWLVDLYCFCARCGRAGNTWCCEEAEECGQTVPAWTQSFPDQS